MHARSGRLRDVFVRLVHQIGRGVRRLLRPSTNAVPTASNRRGVRRERSGPCSWDGVPRALYQSGTLRRMM